MEQVGWLEHSSGFYHFAISFPIEVLTGFHRYLAVRKLKFKEIRVEEGKRISFNFNILVIFTP